MTNALCKSSAIALLFVGFIGGAGEWLRGEDAPQTKPATKQEQGDSSLDDELLKDLGGTPAKKKTLEKSSAPAKNAPAKKSTDSDLDDELLQGLGGKKPTPRKGDSKTGDEPAPAANSGKDDPVGEVSRQMREVEQLLKRTKAAAAAANEDAAKLEQRQQEIVDKLASLIDKLEQQQQQQSSSSKSSGSSSGSQQRQQVSQPQKSSQPGSNPSSQESSTDLVKKKTEKVDMAKMQDTLKDIWGQLPPRLREQMLQSGVEKFVPKYELLIEQYFKTLAERQSSEAP